MIHQVIDLVKRLHKKIAEITTVGCVLEFKRERDSKMKKVSAYTGIHEQILYSWWLNHILAV
jgi:AICAR transformylase/IMP cyclohydrolase PurH